MEESWVKELTDSMLSDSVFNYIALLYGILLGLFFPLIFLHGKLYFKKHKLELRTLVGYFGRFAIVYIFYSVIVAAFVLVILMYKGERGLFSIVESNWYLIGIAIGLFGGMLLCKIGLRQARKQGQEGGV